MKRRRACARGRLRLLAVLLVAGAGCLTATPTFAATQAVLGGHTVSGKAIPCMAADGVRVCSGTDGGGGQNDLRLKSFDGSPLALYITLPPVPQRQKRERPYPLIVLSHGWASPTTGPTDTQYAGPSAVEWAARGFAVLQLDARGFGDSCGTPQSRLADPQGCLNGYIHLDDERYEVRDIQYAVGLLVDEGIVDPHRIAADGESYGAGVTLELATLKNRVVRLDGALIPWRSPKGVPLSLRVAVAAAPWSDLVDALAPNGHTLDYQIASPTTDLSPVGVEKESFVNGLYALGYENGYPAPPAVNPTADLTGWLAALDAGEPYTTQNDVNMVEQIARYHSAYYVLDGAYGARPEPPPPMMLLNGFTDDLFPVDQAVRYYNLEHARFPSDPVALLDFDGGHMRGQNKPADAAYAISRVREFLTYYLTRRGPKPQLGVTALTQTCPKAAPSGGPYWASTWAGLHPGEVDYGPAATQTVLSTAGNPQVSATFDPILSDGLANLGTSMACQTAPASPEGPGVATYRLPVVTGAGYTLLGAPTVIARLKATGAYPYVAARLLDVNPATNTEILVARGVYRLDPASPDGLQVFQLHPGAWHFAAGHQVELELLGRDAPYLRPSNGTFAIEVSDLQLRLPVHERPGSAPGVTAPLPHVYPGWGTR